MPQTKSNYQNIHLKYKHSRKALAALMKHLNSLNESPSNFSSSQFSRSCSTYSSTENKDTKGVRSFSANLITGLQNFYNSKNNEKNTDSRLTNNSKV